MGLTLLMLKHYELKKKLNSQIYRMIQVELGC